MEIQELKDEALHLDPKGRAHLARELLASLDIMSDVEVERLWLDEAIRRDAELDEGTEKAYSAHEVLARARTRRR